MKDKIIFRTTEKQKSAIEKLAKKNGKELSVFMRLITDYVIDKQLILVNKVTAKH
jgi:hypothetical protein